MVGLSKNSAHISNISQKYIFSEYYSPYNIEGVARPLHRWSGGGGMVVGLSSASGVTAARALVCPNLRAALLNHFEIGGTADWNLVEP